MIKAPSPLICDPRLSSRPPAPAPPPTPPRVLSCPRLRAHLLLLISASQQRMKLRVCAHTHVHDWKRDFLAFSPSPSDSTRSSSIFKKKDKLNIVFFWWKLEMAKRACSSLTERWSQCWAVRLSSRLLSRVLCCFRYSIRSACFSTTSSRLEPSLW